MKADRVRWLGELASWAHGKAKPVKRVNCKHCGAWLPWHMTAMAYGPNPGDCDGSWCESCYRILSELDRLVRPPVHMPEWPMRYGPRMEVWPWWEASA